MVVAEAVAYGQPVLAPRTGALADLVLPEGGIVVSPNDTEALRDALSRLLSEPEVLARFTKGAREARERLPDWSQACAEAARILDQASSR
jgi:glycosyltransferase involved in cell wall biosynthesis